MTWETVGFVLYGAIGVAIAGWHLVKVWPHLSDEPTFDAFTLSGVSRPKEAAVRDHLLLFAPLWPIFLLTLALHRPLDRWFTGLVLKELAGALARARMKRK